MRLEAAFELVGRGPRCGGRFLHDAHATGSRSSFAHSSLRRAGAQNSSLVMLRAWQLGIGLRRLVSQRIAAGAAATSRPTSCAGWARCRPRTTTSRCGRSGPGSWTRRPQASSARSRIARSCAPGSCAGRSTSRWPRTCAGCWRSVRPRLRAADERRCAQIGLEAADIERSAELLRGCARAATGG